MNGAMIRLQRIVIAMASLCLCVASSSCQNPANSLLSYDQNEVTDSIFGFYTWEYGDLTLPYRAAVVAADAQQKPALVVYLHGGPKRGSDNVRQMQEPAIYSIADYLLRSRICAIMIVPHCPYTLEWGEGTNEAVKALIDVYVSEDLVDPARIYLLGGSMGGTGSWLLTSAYPNFFAAVMPVAGNPESADADDVATTPVYTVMGTDDNLMTIPRVSAFVELLKERGGEVLLDTEDGWSHIQTCEDSYTDARLAWLFQHTR